MRSKKSTSQKLTVVLLAVILVLCCTIGGTLAFLSAESGTVTNTFTVGKIEIELKEHELLEDGTLGAEEVTENEYKILPGATQNKDPFVRVKVGSEKCHVYVCVENSMVAEGTVVATPNIDTADWIAVDTSGTKTVYRYKEVVDALTAEQKLTVFTTVTYDGEKITEKNIAELAENGVIKLQAFAHQSENTDVATADEAACTKFGVTTVTP